MTKTSSSPAKPAHRVVKLDPKPGAGGLQYIGGSASDDFNYVLADQTMKTAWIGNSTDPNWTAQIHQASADALKGIAPKDEVEGMLAAQMVATHNPAMECYRRAMLAEQTFSGREMALTQANKLTRSYATLVQALDKHRGKGQQKVTVEHVHVGEGGRAIFGDVHHGGGQPQPETPQVQLSHSPLQPMPMAASEGMRAEEALSESLVGVGVEQNDDD